MKLMYETTIAASNTLESEKAMRDCLALICNAIHWPVGHIFIKKDELSLISAPFWYLKDPERAADFKKISDKMVFTKGIGLPGRIWESGKPAWIEDVEKDTNFPRAALCVSIDVHGAAGFPVFVNHELIAIFEFFTYDTAHYNAALLQMEH